MVKDNRIKIEPADDWESYSMIWNDAMKHHYWYHDSPVFDFNRYEETDEMRIDFEKPGNLFLTARFRDQHDIIGVLGLRQSTTIAKIRRWEPAVIPEFRESGAAEALLDYALRCLASMGLKNVSYLMKHPVDSPESIAFQNRLFTKVGFQRGRPDSVDMVRSLETLKQPPKLSQDMKIEKSENYELEDLASIIVESFTSTTEERAIHGFDRTVSEHIQATALLHRIEDGYYGHSSSDFRKVAVIEGLPAGFLSAFVLYSKYKPLIGVIGPMAVLPNYRRRGIASHLIQEVLLSLKEYGCEYAAVGTPAANIGAIDLYRKAGFGLACRIISLEKQL